MAYCRINSHICSSSSTTHNKPFLARKLQSRALTGSSSKAKSWLPNSAGSSGSPHLYRPDLRLHNISCSIGFKSELSAAERGSARGFSTLYELLEIEKDVGFAEIKSAYRKMARRYHPDVWPASHKEQSTKLFLMVHEAYDTLSDPAKRAHYDHQLLLHNMNCHGPAGRSSIKGGAATTMWSQWEAQVAALKYRRRSAVMTESWGSRMRSASNHGRPDSSPL